MNNNANQRASLRTRRCALPLQTSLRRTNAATPSAAAKRKPAAPRKAAAGHIVAKPCIKLRLFALGCRQEEACRQAKKTAEYEDSPANHDVFEALQY